MEKKDKLVLSLELLWWVVTAVVVYVMLIPIHRVMHDWMFQTWNIVFIVTLVTFTRYIFLLKHTWIARRQVIKVVFILLMFPLTFMLISGLNAFLSFIEEKTWEPLTGHLPPLQRQSTESYIWGEMLFFGAGSVIAAPAFAIRLFISVWRLHNRGKV